MGRWWEVGGIGWLFILWPDGLTSGTIDFFLSKLSITSLCDQKVNNKKNAILMLILVWAHLPPPFHYKDYTRMIDDRRKIHKCWLSFFHVFFLPIYCIYAYTRKCVPSFNPGSQKFLSILPKTSDSRPQECFVPGTHHFDLFAMGMTFPVVVP